MFCKKGEASKEKQIPVLPKNYRSISLRAIEIAQEPRVYANEKEIIDFSEGGKLTQKEILKLLNFKILDGKQVIMGFHDHPNQMFVTENYENFA